MSTKFNWLNIWSQQMMQYSEWLQNRSYSNNKWMVIFRRISYFLIKRNSNSMATSRNKIVAFGDLRIQESFFIIPCIHHASPFGVLFENAVGNAVIVNGVRYREMKEKMFDNNPKTIHEIKDAIDEFTPTLCENVIENFVKRTKQYH